MATRETGRDKVIGSARMAGRQATGSGGTQQRPMADGTDHWVIPVNGRDRGENMLADYGENRDGGERRWSRCDGDQLTDYKPVIIYPYFSPCPSQQLYLHMCSLSFLLKLPAPCGDHAKGFHARYSRYICRRETV